MEKNPIIFLDIKSDETICPYCNGKIVTDGITGELVCTCCGTVIVERQETLLPDQHEFISNSGKIRTGLPRSFLMNDSGLDTYIGSPSKYKKINRVKSIASTYSEGHDLKKEDSISNTCSLSFQKPSSPIPIKRLIKLNLYSISNRSTSRNLRKANWELARVCSVLGLNSSVCERSAYFYRKAVQKNLVRGRTIPSFVCACLYLACKERTIPRTIEEICNVVNTDKFFSIHCYKILIEGLQICPPVTDSFRNISKISAKAGIDEKTSRRAREILESVNNHPIIMGKNPVVLAAAALYIAWREFDQNVSKAVISDAAGVSTISLRNRIADISYVIMNNKSCANSIN